MAMEIDPNIITPLPNSQNEVSGPMLVFWLACFAANAVGQPSGRVCGLRFRHRAILRSSPVIVFFDAIQILILWFGNSYSEGSIRGPARSLLRARVVDEHDQPDEQAMASLRSHTVIRWVLFTITVMPQYIKLFASTGAALVPAQIFGAMFLVSWLTIEMLIVVSKNDAVNDAGPLSTALVHPRRWSMRSQARIQRSIALLAISAHTILYCGGLLRFGFDKCSALEKENDSTSIRMMIYMFYYLYGSLGLLFSVGVWAVIATGSDYIEAAQEWVLERPNGDIIKEFWRFANLRYALEILWSVHLVLYIVVGFLGWLFGLDDTRMALPVVGLLLGALALKRYKSILTRHVAIYAPFIYYLTLYNPAGTFSPSWFGWLG